MSKFGRLLTAMVTPFFENGNVDYKTARILAKKIIKSGSDGLVIGGTTGEAPSMTDDEKIKLFQEIKDEIGDSGDLIAGTTDNNTNASINLSKRAESAGVDGILLTVPAYNKPTMGGLISHFQAITDNISIPGILYNVPSRTSLNMDVETTLKLASFENIIGTKEASSDLDQISNIIKDSPSDFCVWSGNDNETFSIMSTGGYGVVSVAGNIISNQIKNMISNIIDGNYKKASIQHLDMLPIFNALFIITNPIPVRYAVNRSGFNIGNGRLPMIPTDAELRNFSKIFDPIMDQYSIDL
ncbi:MAG: 4-hydroxy-tetrahydrodipicolinate synthase [Dehalococcoidia bacterium]